MARCQAYWFELRTPTHRGESSLDRLMRVDCDKDAEGTYTYTEFAMQDTYGTDPLELCHNHIELAKLEDAVARRDPDA